MGAPCESPSTIQHRSPAEARRIGGRWVTLLGAEEGPPLFLRGFDLPCKSLVCLGLGNTLLARPTSPKGLGAWSGDGGMNMGVGEGRGLLPY